MTYYDYQESYMACYDYFMVISQEINELNKLIAKCMSENQKHRKLSYKHYLIYLVEYFVPSSKKKFKRFLKLSQILPRRSKFFWQELYQ